MSPKGLDLYGLMKSIELISHPFDAPSIHSHPAPSFPLQENWAGVWCPWQGPGQLPENFSGATTGVEVGGGIRLKTSRCQACLFEFGSWDPLARSDSHELSSDLHPRATAVYERVHTVTKWINR